MTTATTPESFTAATSEGLAFFWAATHVGHTAQFVGQLWEDGGFSVDDDGNPLRDGLGNTVSSYRVEALDAANPQHVRQCEEWYTGN